MDTSTLNIKYFTDTQYNKCFLALTEYSFNSVQNYWHQNSYHVQNNVYTDDVHINFDIAINYIAQASTQVNYTITNNSTDNMHYLLEFTTDNGYLISTYPNFTKLSGQQSITIGVNNYFLDLVKDDTTNFVFSDVQNITLRTYHENVAYLTDSYETGYNNGYQIGYDKGYSIGYNDSSAGSTTENGLTILTQGFNAFGGLLQTKVFGNFSIANLLAIPFCVACILALIRLIK